MDPHKSASEAHSSEKGFLQETEAGLGPDTGSRGKAEHERDVLSRTSVELAGARSAKDIAEILRRTTEEFWDWDAFQLMIRRSGRVLMRPILQIDTIEGDKKVIPPGGPEINNPLREGPLKEGKPLLINREPGEPATMPRFGDRSRASASLIFAPVRSGAHTIATISVQSYTPGHFGEEDAELLLRVAKTAGPALARCYAEQRSAAYASLGARMSSARTSEEVGRIAAEVSDELLGWDAFMLDIYSPADESLMPLVNFDIVEGVRQRVRPPGRSLSSESLTWRTLKEGPLLVLRQQDEEQEIRFGFGDTSRPSASLMFVPVQGAAKTVGVMSVQSYTPAAYDEEDLSLLHALAHYCAGALERTQADDLLRGREERYRTIITAAGAVPYQLEYATNRYIFVGEGIQAITGYAPEEFTSELFRSLIVRVIPHGEGTGFAPRDAAKLARLGEMKEWRADIQIRTKSGEIRWLSDTTGSLHDEHGHPIGSLGILQDITDRKQSEEALRESEERYRRAITVAGAVPYERDYQQDTFVFVGDRIEDITGYPAATFSIADFREMIQEVVIDGEGLGMDTAKAVEAARKGQIGNWSSDIRIQTKQGEDRWLFDASIELLDANGQPRGSLGILQDITDRKKAEQALRESQERYALAVEGANDGLWDWDIAAGRVYFSPRWLAMLGYAPGELGNTLGEWLDRIHPDDREAVDAGLESHIHSKTDHYESEYRMRHRDGQYLWVLARGVTVRDPEGHAYRMAGSLTDVTDRKKAEERLIHGAYHDLLTGLPNRAHFREMLSRVLARASRRENYRFAVLFLDMDRFKVINDSLGHAAGDRFLVETARRLEKCLRPGDMVARLGGDEFTVLLDDLRDDEDAQRVANRIHDSLSSPFLIDGQQVYSSASIGIALGTEGYHTPEEIIRDADTAMYHAKEAGKTRSSLFSGEMHSVAVDRLRLETDLRRALEQTNGFYLQYQPIVSFDSGLIHGCEALVRWRHPERGLVTPGEFIPMAEETGLIIPLGWWVLERACRQLQSWQRYRPAVPPLLVTVNVSVAQLMQADFYSGVETLLKTYALPPGSLVLEITETQLMSHAERLVELLGQLKRLGVELYVDDFGTGYSSLAYLHQFPIDVLKIDRSFVARVGEESGTQEIVRAIVTLGHSMQMRVVAEGIETAKQMKLMAELGCNYGQGYFFSRPADTHAIVALLDRGFVECEGIEEKGKA